MNASATIRASYINASRMSMRPAQMSGMYPIRELDTRPPRQDKLSNFQPIDYAQHRELCEKERENTLAPQEVFWSDAEKGYIDNSIYENMSFMDFDEDKSIRKKIRKMYTIFPYRDPIYLVAVVFAIGSLDLVLNAFFDLLPRTIPSTKFETEETIAVPATVLIGAVLFFAAGIFDTFGALNADRGTIETSKDADGNMGRTEYKPALLGTPEWNWIPTRVKFFSLLSTNLAFQAGLIVLFGGIIFMFAGVVDFPELVDEETSTGKLVVFAPQVVHGFLFLIANGMLAIAEQDKWYKPKIWSADWQGSFLNAIGGFGFMMAGFFLFSEGEVEAAIAAMGGSFAFLIGSLIRWYVAMEFC
ncbi:hypothetical protein K504DRAFT_479466 [Pleomassaria siparia CBS 279.74]|uniref:Integral membrane protein n=1 Tax=Pleomassaria siparia CBS 279.74 TaxID=1314801 RepID=A0A6G1KLX3_9PLEO|nr:hypothetical protein K504DRAFT_479466 [Pleomassaria siparia CBS 279.74]